MIRENTKGGTKIQIIPIILPPIRIKRRPRRIEK
jgi:hypothetical protein